ncbi:MAG: TlyA family RNA methyltransferase [Dermatophilaceae bacterium]
MSRLDVELMRRGLVRSRGEARDLVRHQAVRVDGRPATKPAQRTETTAHIEVDHNGPRWVGRAAGKLVDALDAWADDGLSIAGRRCIDIGASTGGFTQVLLSRGADIVVAVDVGHGQLDHRIASDPRVDDRSGVSVRGITGCDLGGRADVVVVDLSFISLRLVAAELAGLLGPGGDLVTLVKPQFEVGRARLGKRGIVTEPAHRRDALRGVIQALEVNGLFVHGLRPSAVIGTYGNTEYLVWARSVPSETMSRHRVDTLVRDTTTDLRSGARR